jgi:hypothetical protein
MLDAGGPVADIVYTQRREPYYEVKIHEEGCVEDAGGGRIRIPAVKLSVSKEISEGAREALRTLQ